MQGGEAPGPLFLAGSWLRAWLRACSPRLWGPRGARANVSSAGGRLCPPPTSNGLEPSPIHNQLLTKVYPQLEERGVGAGMQPKAGRCKGGGKPERWVRGS